MLSLEIMTCAHERIAVQFCRRAANNRYRRPRVQSCLYLRLVLTERVGNKFRITVYNFGGHSK